MANHHSEVMDHRIKHVQRTVTVFTLLGSLAIDSKTCISQMKRNHTFRAPAAILLSTTSAIAVPGEYP